MKTPLRPIPVPTSENKPFWDAAKRGRLSLAKCHMCGHIPYPPQPRCPKCLTESLEWIDLSGEVRLLGWTDIHMPAIPGHPSPVSVIEAKLLEDPTSVIVALDEGGMVRHCAPDTLLKISFREDKNGWTYPEVSDVSKGNRK